MTSDENDLKWKWPQSIYTVDVCVCVVRCYVCVCVCVYYQKYSLSFNSFQSNSSRICNAKFGWVNFETPRIRKVKKKKKAVSARQQILAHCMKHVSVVCQFRAVYGCGTRWVDGTPGLASNSQRSGVKFTNRIAKQTFIICLFIPIWKMRDIRVSVF